MNEENNTTQPEQTTPVKPKVPSKYNWKFVLLIAGAFAALFFAIMMFGTGAAIFASILGEPTQETKSNTTTCSSWSNAPTEIQQVIENAATKIGVSKPLLGAIFLSENGNNWNKAKDFVNKGKWIDGPWQSSSKGAQGPFQFMPDTWEGQGLSIENDNVCCQNDLPADNPKSCKNKNTKCHKPNPQNIYDATYSAALYIKGVAEGNGFSPYTTIENEVKCIGAGYNGGGGMCKSWKERSFASPEPNTNDHYHTRTWEHFQNLEKSCDVMNIIPSDVGDNSDLTWDKSYMQKDPIKSWLKKRGKIIPTGITIHWTGPTWKSNDPQSLIDTWHANGDVFNHFVVSPDGKIYQLIPANLKQAGSGIGKIKGNIDGEITDISANDFTIGIEIAGGSPQYLKDRQNQAQGKAVIALIKKLKELYPTIVLRQGSRTSFKDGNGVFGHFQTQGGAGAVVGCSGTRNHPDPGLDYMKWIWKEIGASKEGSDCGF